MTTQIEIRAGEKSGQEDHEWMLKREKNVRATYCMRENHYVSYQRVFKGNQDFSKQLKTAITDYLANIYPHLIANATYFDTKIMFNMEFPVDEAVCLLPYWGIIDVLDKRCVNVAITKGQDIKMDPVSIGTRLHFNAVLRVAKDTISMLSVAKQEILRSLLASFLTDGHLTPNDKFSGLKLNNAQLMQALEMAVEITNSQDMNSNYHKALIDPKQLESFVIELDKYRQEYIFPQMKRRYMKSFTFAQFSDPYGLWSMEDITKMYERYILNLLPRRDWNDTYALDTQFKYYEPMKALRFREAIFSAGRYNIVMRPPTKRSKLPHNGLAIARVQSALYNSYDINIDKMFEGELGMIKNVGAQGSYTPVLPFAQRDAALVEKGGKLAGWEYLLPGYGKGETYYGTKITDDSVTLIPEFVIVPDYSVLLRLISMIDATRPTVLSFLTPENTYCNILCLPDFGGDVKIDPVANSLIELKSTREDTTIEGSIVEDYYKSLPAFFKNRFIQTNVHTYGRTEVGMHQILGI